MKDDRKNYQFYIDLTGKVHKLKGNVENIISIHYSIVHKLFPDIDNPDEYVKNLGWILCGSSVYGDPIIHKKPTQAQINTLNELNLFDKLCFEWNGRYENYKKYGIFSN